MTTHDHDDLDPSNPNLHPFTQSDGTFQDKDFSLASMLIVLRAYVSPVLDSSGED